MLAALCIMQALALPIYAEEESITASYDENSGLSIIGRIGSDYGAAVLAVITHNSNVTDESIAPDLTKSMTATYVFNTKARGDAAAAGDFAAVLPLPTEWYDAESNETRPWYNGEYRLYLYSEKDTASTVFSYSLKENLLSLIDDVNAAASESDIKALLTEPANRLAVSSAFSAECVDETAKVFYQNKRTSYKKDDTGTALLQEDYKAAEAVGRLRSGADIADIINEYAAFFAADRTAFEKYGDDVKNGICSYLKKADYTALKDSDGSYSEQTAAKTAYFDACLFSEIRYAQDWSALKTAVVKYDDAINPDKDSYFTKVVNKDDVYIKMWDNRAAEITNAASIKTAFEKYAQTVYKAEKSKKESSGGSGGGGGGGIRGTVQVGNDIVNKINEGTIKKDTPVFGDISGHWASEYITALAEKGVVSGFEDNTFRPNALVTRAELVTMMLSALDKKPETGDSFNDVNESDWYAQYLAAAYRIGMIKGDSDGNFRPNDCITRQDAATIIYRALNLSDDGAADETAFIDYNEISDYARAAVASMHKSGIISGMPDGSFAPLSCATRAEAAVMIMRAVYK